MAIFTLNIITGCTKMAYDTLHNVSKKQCYDNPNFEERQECIRKYEDMNYEKYQRIYKEK
ncbi:hypothetical protein FJR48_01870 [Sulfurimonas lithotrophica]|uniref:Uncharacterized protein n=1 Tax=Sulfurimonas lithotrophica TaxID=2590022 RepID=A0A5P8NYN6_9BACT|nr:hypothetical protein [Sulfurimonas lithotrophica]QFR48539.1 hypothetical protein FJR48_01870 [Sulfurimonas lithotrophica]